MDTIALIATALIGTLLLGLLIAGLAQKPPCPGCKARGTVSWLHPNKNGGQDGRFKINYQECSACEWVSPWEAERRQTMIKITHNLNEAFEKAIASLKEEAKIQEGESFSRAFVWLLKYIALADRRFTEGERQMIISHVKRTFPQERVETLTEWAETLSPDPFHLSEKLAFFKEASEADREGLLQALSDMATADGKATKGEMTRIAEIRKGLGL